MASHAAAAASSRPSTLRRLRAGPQGRGLQARRRRPPRGPQRKTRTRRAQPQGPAQAGLAHRRPLRCHLRRRRRPASRPRRRRGQGRRARVRHAPHPGEHPLRPPRANPYRDAWAGELDAARVGEHVRVAGWVHRRRDHGGADLHRPARPLRDRPARLPPRDRAEALALAERLRPEHVLTAAGEVVRREERNVNPNLKTGEIELSVADAEHLAESLTPPFAIDEDGQVDEMIRLRHRMLDLRRESMQEAMILRHTVNRAIRDYLNANDFLEIETPILTRSTPEGARDFLVPARLTPGRVLRAAAVAAAVQAAADDERLRALLPDRPLLPRRGPARRPPARVHPARPRDGLRRGGGRPRRRSRAC